MPAEKTEEGLKRVIGEYSLAVQVVNFTIGAGIFALPALIGLQLGGYSLAGYLLCALMFSAIILCYVETGSRVKTSGGSYAYTEAAFGPFAGFLVNWLFFFGWGILGDAAVLNIVADSLTLVFPGLSVPFFRGLFIFLLIGLMTWLNIRDTRKSVRFIAFVTLAKLIPLLAFIILGVSHIQLHNLHPGALPSWNALNDTALILFFAFAGFETSLNVSGEIKEPKRTIPRGILLGGILVIVIYMLVQLVTQGVLGAELSDNKNAPLVAAAGRIAGVTGLTIMLLATALSGFGSVNGDILASPRLLFAGAIDGLFPKFLGKLHPRFATPYLAVITYALVIFIFSISGGFKQLAVLASGTLLLVYLAVVLATIRFRIKAIPGEENSFTVPGGLLVPGIAILFIGYMLSNLNRKEALSIFIFILLLSVIYLPVKKWQKNKMSAGPVPAQNNSKTNQPGNNSSSNAD